MTDTKDRIIKTTSDLLENQGYHGTGLNEIVKVSGAPKGSIYYHFPGGKDDIVAQAVLYAGELVSERITANLAEKADPAEAIQSFLETIAHYVEVSGFRSGGPLTIVASETATTNDQINLTCQRAYELMIAAFDKKLLDSGYSVKKANSLAWLITSTIEGSIILCRTFHSGDPLRKAARELAQLIHQNKEENPEIKID